VVPGAVLTCLPLLAFVWQPGLAGAVALLFVAGLGCAYMPGFDQTLLAASDEGLRGRTLATQTAGLMFAQGVGFAACGLAVVAIWRPRHSSATEIGTVA
jgi:hypothetical protein